MIALRHGASSLNVLSEIMKKACITIPLCLVGFILLVALIFVVTQKVSRVRFLSKLDENLVSDCRLLLEDGNARKETVKDEVKLGFYQVPETKWPSGIANLKPREVRVLMVTKEIFCLQIVTFHWVGKQKGIFVFKDSEDAKIYSGSFDKSMSPYNDHVQITPEIFEYSVY